jgi:hypothetical protein
MRCPSDIGSKTASTLISLGITRGRKSLSVQRAWLEFSIDSKHQRSFNLDRAITNECTDLRRFVQHEADQNSMAGPDDSTEW